MNDIQTADILNSFNDIFKHVSNIRLIILSQYRKTNYKQCGMKQSQPVSRYKKNNDIQEDNFVIKTIHFAFLEIS